jgi:hypothetical protein
LVPEKSHKESIHVNRLVALSAGLLLLAAGAAAEDVPANVETVIVHASALDGVWKINVPDYFGIQVNRAEWGDLRDTFCRIESQNDDDVRIHCLSWLMLRNGTVSLDDGKIHLAWGSMMVRLVLDGTLQSAAQFDGNFAFKFSGIRFDNPAPTGAQKISLSKDKGGDTELLERLLADGARGAPSAVSYVKKEIDVSFLKQENLQALGQVQSVVYLGQIPYYNRASDPHPKPENHQQWLENRKARDFMGAYAVEFQNGQRICELHRQPDGRIDRFACV